MNIGCLPMDLMDEILLKLEPKSLVIMGCTNKYFRSRIFEDPEFEVKYFSQVGSKIILSCIGNIKCYPMSLRVSTDIPSKIGYILDSCSGLLLVLYEGRHLFVVNPLTKKVGLIDYSGSKILPKLIAQGHVPTALGFLAERNRTTKRFKIVYIIETTRFDTYEFEIYDGDSWRLSKTTITTPASKSSILLDKSVYFDGSFHWLRCDGSIIAFNPEKEQACLIPSRFPESFIPSIYSTQLFAVDDKLNRLTYILGTSETILVFTLLNNSEWTLARQIKNIIVCDNDWNIVVYDGKQLVVLEGRFIVSHFVGGTHVSHAGTSVHVYNMEANSWEVSSKCEDGIQWNYLKFTPSFFSSENEHTFEEIVTYLESEVSDEGSSRPRNTTSGNTTSAGVAVSQLPSEKDDDVMFYC